MTLPVESDHIQEDKGNLCIKIQVHTRRQGEFLYQNQSTFKKMRFFYIKSENIQKDTGKFLYKKSEHIQKDKGTSLYEKSEYIQNDKGNFCMKI